MRLDVAVAAIALTLVGGFAWLLRAAAAANERRRSMLRTVAAAHRWRLEFPRGTAFELSGRSASGIAWTLREDAGDTTSDESPSSPARRWLTRDVRADGPTLLIEDRRDFERARGSRMLAVADAMVRATGLSSGGIPQKTLYEHGHEHRFADERVRRRFVAWTADDARAAKVLQPGVERLLAAWPSEHLQVLFDASGLAVQSSFGVLDRSMIEGIVELGVALADAARTA